MERVERIQILIRDLPHRSIALKAASHVLIFRYSPPSTEQSSRNASQVSLPSTGNGVAPRCMVEFSALDAVDLGEYRSLSTLSVHGTLGLITVDSDVFLCVVNRAEKVAALRPGETVQRIQSVEFREPPIFSIDVRG